MALGKRKNTVEGKLLILRIRNKTTDKETNKEIPLMPNQFEVLEKNEAGKWVAREKMETAVGGNLTRIEFETDEYDGKEYQKVKFYFTDPEAQEIYMIDGRMTKTIRDLANSLLNLESFENLNVSLYKTTSKKDGKDYSNVSLWQSDLLVKGKYTLDQAPKPEAIKNSKGVVLSNDYSLVDEFYLGHLKELAKVVNGGKKVSAATKKEDVEEVLDKEVPSEDVPF